jgi:hypothetical protein
MDKAAQNEDQNTGTDDTSARRNDDVDASNLSISIDKGKVREHPEQQPEYQPAPQQTPAAETPETSALPPEQPAGTAPEKPASAAPKQEAPITPANEVAPAPEKVVPTAPKPIALGKMTKQQPKASTITSSGAKELLPFVATKSTSSRLPE